jgi:hypothetical protein
VRQVLRRGRAERRRHYGRRKRFFIIRLFLFVCLTFAACLLIDCKHWSILISFYRLLYCVILCVCRRYRFPTELRHRIALSTNGSKLCKVSNNVYHYSPITKKNNNIYCFCYKHNICLYLLLLTLTYVFIFFVEIDSRTKRSQG